MQKYNKFLMSLFPLMATLGAWVGFDVTAEWWQAVVTVATPLLVYFAPNKG